MTEDRSGRRTTASSDVDRRVGGPAAIGADERAVTPAVSKTLEMGIVVLFVGLLSAVLLGSVVPEYRSAVDARVGERVLATAGSAIEDAPPAAGETVDTSRRVELPARIGGHGYALRIDGRSLVLDHPDPAVEGRSRLLLPDRVDSVAGEWHSGTDAVVHVRGARDGLLVELREAET